MDDQRDNLNRLELKVAELEDQSHKKDELIGVTCVCVCVCLCLCVCVRGREREREEGGAEDGGGAA